MQISTFTHFLYTHVYATENLCFLLHSIKALKYDNLINLIKLLLFSFLGWAV